MNLIKHTLYFIIWSWNNNFFIAVKNEIVTYTLTNYMIYIYQAYNEELPSACGSIDNIGKFSFEYSLHELSLL